MSKEKQTQDALLEAIDIAVENKLKKLGFNYYVDGVIKGKNTDNTYNVLINGEIYNNVPSKNNFEYSVNDVVQVLIKNGNWNKKFIDDKKQHNEIPQNILNIEQDILNIEQNYFCLSQRIRIPAGADVNDYKTAGNYTIENYTDSKTIKNLPTMAQGLLTVYYCNNSEFNLRQEYVSYLSNTTYVRRIFSNNNGLTWTYMAWDKILGKSDLSNELPDALAYTSVKDALLDLVYPIGSIYMSVNNTNPSGFIGGTWEAWGSGKVPVGVNTFENEFNEVEKTGGEKTHTLTTDQMPVHTHTQEAHSHTPLTRYGFLTYLKGKITREKVALSDDGRYDIVESATSTASTERGMAWDVCTNSVTPAINEVGGGEAHNNLQPYITCYMWKRTE